MFSHETFQRQMSTVMEVLVDAAVSEMSRLLDECSSPTSHKDAVKEESRDVTEEGTHFTNPSTSKFASLMETWTKEAVEKIAAMLRLSLGQDGPHEKITTPRRAKAKTADGPTKQFPIRRTSGRMRNKNGGSESAQRDKEVDQANNDVILEDDIAGPQPLPDVTHPEVMLPGPVVPGHSADDDDDDDDDDEVPAEPDVVDALLAPEPTTPSPAPDTARVKQSKRSRADPIQCPTCDKTFALKCWFDRHYLTHSKPHLCPQCGKRFSRAEGLTAHARKHTGEKLYKCAECAAEFAYKSTYSRHMRRHTVQNDVQNTHTLTCAFCEGRFSGARSLQRHTCTAVGKTFLCSICPQTFASGKALAEHEDALHTGESRDFVCEMCGERFLSVASLCAHRVVHLQGRHGGDEEVTMEACCVELGLGCSDAGVLRHHLRQKHAGEKEFVCEVCGKGCSHRSALKHHMLTHTGERSFVCETCGKRCGHASALQNHTRVHTGQKPGKRPVCDVCGKCLSSMVKLRYHMSVHTGELPFPCERCGKRFRNPSNLRKHAITHTGAKPYGCAICGRRFTAARTLKVHRQKHTGERP
ncbi:Oocyte zinc finger protein XlCOF6 [Merluccius polli]|uniref:Oocyte zinc finger protein XlCOF6 n=1 Tax=Merluccius polli TaxID=89951 RepID=A0AA47MY34_MERPO|nr:Oocyte zinc finger protein XlCOF6 [Merluccius polli]